MERRSRVQRIQRPEPPYQKSFVNLIKSLDNLGTNDIIGAVPGTRGNTTKGYSKENLAQGIIDTAKALQVDPIHLATIISYETAGTFDPTKRGPTTQWGEHRGFIQFGEPQAKQHGVDWDDPYNSQLGKGKGIYNYFMSSGLKPGMGLLDMYSIVNAGAPGRYNASDANNGGAPGTVRDKVQNQMSGHRQRAQSLLLPYLS